MMRGLLASSCLMVTLLLASCAGWRGEQSAVRDSAVQRKTVVLWIDQDAQDYLWDNPSARQNFLRTATRSGVTHLAFEQDGQSSPWNPRDPMALELRSSSMGYGFVYTGLVVEDGATTTTLAQRAVWNGESFDRDSIMADPGGVVRASPLAEEVVAHDRERIVALATDQNADFIILNGIGFHDLQSDFSDLGRTAFQNNTGLIIRNWPSDVVGFEPPTSPFDPQQRGRYWSLWLAWRARVMQQQLIALKEDLITADATPPPVFLLVDAPYPSHLREGINWAHPLSIVSEDHQWLAPGYQQTASGHLIEGLVFGYWQSDLLSTTDAEEAGFAWWASFEGATALARRYVPTGTIPWGAVLVDGDNWPALVRSSVAANDGVLVIGGTEFLKDGTHWTYLREALSEPAR